RRAGSVVHPAHRPQRWSEPIGEIGGIQTTTLTQRKQILDEVGDRNCWHSWPPRHRAGGRLRASVAAGTVPQSASRRIVVVHILSRRWLTAGPASSERGATGAMTRHCRSALPSAPFRPAAGPANRFTFHPDQP